MTYDFSGYVTKFNVRCSDGRIIKPSSFQHMDGKKVALVWNHNPRDVPENVMGHVLLEWREDGMYGYAKTNDSDRGKHVKSIVEHGDVESFSIRADRLKENGKEVIHGRIVEVSLVHYGANPGAYIDNVQIAHSDGSYEESSDEALIYTDEGIVTDEEALQPQTENSEGEFKMADNEDGTKDNAEKNQRTVADIYQEMTPEQQKVTAYLVEQALLSADEDGDDDVDAEAAHSDTEGDDMSRNAFEHNGEDKAEKKQESLSHSDLKSIVQIAANRGMKFHDAALAHADEYGITNIEMLFPDAKMVSTHPEFIKRRTEWVSNVLTGTKHVPFSRIKTMQADITADEARAKGYIKADRKKDEFFNLLSRETTPQTIYKRQKFDRDDIIDVVDFDLIAWVKGEMRLMLEEEIARAILVGDGRAVDDREKIREDRIRPIAKEDALYAPRIAVPAVNGSVLDSMMDAAIMSRDDYEGSGGLTLYTSSTLLGKFRLQRDKDGRRIYRDAAEIASAMGVSNIVPVPHFKGLKNADGNNILGVAVDLRDYSVGADKGGQTTYFEDFDIDFNQHKYLYETRISGALTRIKSALVFESTAPLVEIA